MFAEHNYVFDLSSSSTEDVCCLCDNKYPSDRPKAYIFGKSDQSLIREYTKTQKGWELTSKLICSKCLDQNFVRSDVSFKILKPEHFLVINDSTQTIYKVKDMNKLPSITGAVCSKIIKMPGKNYLNGNKTKKNDYNKENMFYNIEQPILSDQQSNNEISTSNIDFTNNTFSTNIHIGKNDEDIKTDNKRKKTNNQMKTFQCHICSIRISRKSRFLLHLQRHESKPSFAKVHSCSNCKMAFKNLQDAQVHISDKECISNVETKVESINKDNLMKEELDSTDCSVIVVEIDRVFRCEYCDRVYCEDSSLLNHMNVHQGIENPFTCNKCTASFPTYSKCMFHKTSHGIPRSGSKFQEITDVDLQLDKFPVVKLFLCDLCGKSYFDRTYFVNHKTQVHIANKSEFKCKICYKMFTSRWNLSRHNRKHHRANNSNGVNFDLRNRSDIISTEPSYHCTECGDSFLRSNDLRTHKRRAHKKKVEKPCPKCNKIYYRCDDLKKHLLTHLKERPFVCDVCKKGFRNKNAYNEHVRIHTGERPFSCDICGLTFKRARAVKSHRLIHTKKRQFKCSHCQQFFVHPSDLKMHIQQCNKAKDVEKLNQSQNLANLVDIDLNEELIIDNIVEHESIIDFENIDSYSNVVINEDLNQNSIDIFDVNNPVFLESQSDFVLVGNDHDIADGSYLISCQNNIFNQMSEGDFLILNENGEENAIWNNFILEDALVCTLEDNI